MGELKSSYDVAIVGTDLPALVFGALAAKNGYRVLLLGHGGRNNVYEENGFRFVRRPNVMYGFTESQSISEIFRELALLPEMRNRPRQIDPICNVVMPEKRLQISHVRDALTHELVREFPGQAGKIENLLRSIFESDSQIDPVLRNLCPVPPNGISGFFKWRGIRKGLQTAAPGGDAIEPVGAADARTFLAAPAAFLTGCAEPWALPLAFNRTTSHLLRGLYNVEWGLDSLKALFLNRIEGNSGTVRASDFVDVIQARRSKVHEIDIQGRNESIGASLLVAATDLENIVERLPERLIGRRWRQRIQDSAPSHAMVTLNIGMARKGLPEGMARNVFIVHTPGARLDGDNLLMLQVDPAMEPADSTDPERAVLSVSGLMPATDFNDVENIEQFCAAMMSRVKTFMPFLDRHVFVTSIPSITLNSRTGKDMIDRMSLPMVYGEPLQGSLGLVSRPIRTPVSNLFNLGDSAAGLMGFEGAFIAAQVAFGMLKRQLPKKDVIQHSR